MALFRKAKSAPLLSALPFAEAPAPVPVAPVEDAIAKQDWDAARGHVLATPPHHRDWTLRLLADAAPYEWAASHVTDAFGQTVAGAVAVMSGWRARSDAQAEQVSRDQFESLWQWLERADQHLDAALAADRTDPTPATYSLITARGRQKPVADADAAFAELKRRDPEHLEGHLQRLQYSCEKWFGSHDQMHSFAAGVSASAPAGSDLHVLPLVAHVERLIAFSGDGAHTQQLAYVSSQPFLASVDRALSLLAPGSYGQVLAHNHLAYFAWIRADLKTFDEAFQAVGCQVTRAPWELYGSDPLAVVRRRSFGRSAA